MNPLRVKELHHLCAQIMPPLTTPQFSGPQFGHSKLFPERPDLLPKEVTQEHLPGQEWTLNWQKSDAIRLGWPAPLSVASAAISRLH